MFQQSHPETSTNPGYFPTHIDIPENTWLFSYNSLGFWSRQDEISREQELNIQISAYRLLKKAAFYKESSINPGVLFNSMLYFLRYFQRKSYKHYNRFVIEALCSFIASRVLESYKSIDEILKKNFEIPPNKEWETKDKIKQIEMSFMGDLCYDLIIQNPNDIMKKLLNTNVGEQEDFLSSNQKHIQMETGVMIELSVATQIYLLYPIEFCVICFITCAMLKRKLQAPEGFFKNTSSNISSPIIMEFFESYNKLVNEIVPIRGVPYTPGYDFTLITENRLKFVLREINEFPEDERVIFTLPNFKQFDNKSVHIPQSAPAQTQSFIPEMNAFKPPKIPVPTIQAPKIPAPIIQAPTVPVISIQAPTTTIPKIQQSPKLPQISNVQPVQPIQDNYTGKTSQLPTSSPAIKLIQSLHSVASKNKKTQKPNELYKLKQENNPEKEILIAKNNSAKSVPEPLHLSNAFDTKEKINTENPINSKDKQTSNYKKSMTTSTDIKENLVSEKSKSSSTPAIVKPASSHPAKNLTAKPRRTVKNITETSTYLKPLKRITAVKKRSTSSDYYKKLAQVYEDIGELSDLSDIELS